MTIDHVAAAFAVLVLIWTVWRYRAIGRRWNIRR